MEIMNRTTFEDKMYEAYKLWWMIMHGFTLKDYVNALAITDDELTFNGDYPEGSADDIYNAIADHVEDETGLGYDGMIWACKNEFLDNEFRDPDVMDTLFKNMPDGTEMRTFWESEYGIRVPEPSIVVGTTAGILRAYIPYVCEHPDQPGICVMYQPAGFEDEIDAAFVSVYENPEYQTEDKERPEDVVVFTYGDATTEDYTTKEIIRREDVIAGLGTAAHL